MFFSLTFLYQQRTSKKSNFIFFKGIKLFLFFKNLFYF